VRIERLRIANPTTKKTYIGIKEGGEEAVLWHSRGKRPPPVKEEDRAIVTRIVAREQGKRETS
jgi:hypothetical protein